MRIIFTLVMMLLLTSCNFLEFRSRDNIVAEVNGYRLYEKDVRNLIPAGTAYNDSILMLRQYINSWSLKYLLLAKANKELSKEDKDVEQEVEDYRNSLIAFRYEKLFVETRLDTVVNENEAREYYINNSHNISLSNSVIKGRVIKISIGSPNLERIRSMYQVSSLEDIDELERICYNSADKYTNFNNQWTDLATVARELPVDLYQCENEIINKNNFESNDSLYTYFAFFTEKILPGNTPPFEYYLPRIKENIIGKRKQDLMRQLEQELIEEALKNNTINTNINDYPQNENQR